MLKKSVGLYCSIGFLASDEKYGNPENEMKGWSSKRVTGWRLLRLLQFSLSPVNKGLSEGCSLFGFLFHTRIFRKNGPGPTKPNKNFRKNG